MVGTKPTTNKEAQDNFYTQKNKIKNRDQIKEGSKLRLIKEKKEEKYWSLLESQ